MIGLIIKGLIIGVLVSAPMGPIGMLCIQRTLNKGRLAGLATGFGAALSDIIYASITCLGMGFVTNFIETNQALLQMIGSIVIALFGYYIFQSNPVKSLQKNNEAKLSLTQDFITSFILTFTNVLIVLLYIGLYARFGFVKTNYSVLMLIGGVVCIAIGALAWWFGITYFVSKLKKWFNVRGVWLLNKIVGSIIILIALVGILSVIFSSVFHLPLLSNITG